MGFSAVQEYKMNMVLSIHESKFHSHSLLLIQQGSTLMEETNGGKYTKKSAKNHLKL